MLFSIPTLTGFTRSVVLLLPNTNAFGITRSMMISAAPVTAGEHALLQPGVHMRDPFRVRASTVNPNGFEETRPNFGEVVPLWLA